MKKSKAKLVSIILTLLIIFGTFQPVFAQEDDYFDKTDYVNNTCEIVNADGQSMMLHSINERNNSTTIEIVDQGNSLVVLNDDAININGIDAITIETLSSEYTPDFTTDYYDSPAFGDSSDYTEYIGTYYRNLKLSNTLGAIAFNLLVGAIALVTKIEPIASLIASSVITALPTYFQDSKALYYIETIYGHYIMPTWYQELTQEFYYDKDYEYYVDTSVIYSARS